jgi:FAD/FMN-containing dehydrogenase
VAANQQQLDAIWAFRHAAAEGNRVAGMAVTADTSVPISLVPDFIEQATEATHAIIPGVPIAVTVHVGDGNVHFVAFFTHDEWSHLADRTDVAAHIRAKVSDVAMRLGGSFSAEHGIGRTFVAQMTEYKSPIELAIMRSIKAALDPSGLFNPGVLLPIGPQFGQ